MWAWRLNPLISDDRSGFFNFSRCCAWLLLLGLAAGVQANGRQPPPDVREADFSGTPCLALEDVAQSMDGHLHWYPVSQRVDLTFRTHEVQFYVGSTRVIADGKMARLELPTQKDERGLWVPKSFFQSGPLARSFRRRIDLGSAPLAEQKPVPAASSAAARQTSSEAHRSAEAPKGPVPAQVVLESSGPAAAPSAEATETDETPAPAEPAAAYTPRSIRRIVIDPGHGGKDPGAMSARGTEEKAVNLWMAQELADALREKNFEVLLTRTDDSFIPLEARAALANKYKADLFISLHCNASLSSRMNGFEVYFLSEKASDPHADAVARLENASLEFEKKPQPPSTVRTVLRSLEKNAYINRAAQLGAIIDRHVSEQMSQQDLGVKQAAFYVLRGADMPAILVELGFLSNKAEEHLLENKAYRQRMIRAIEAGILEFDRKQPKHH